MAESNQSPEPLDMDSAINHVAGLLGKLDPELADNEDDQEQSEEPEDQDEADETDAEDSDDEDQEDADDDEEDVDEDDGEPSDDPDSDPWKVARKVTVDGKQIEISPEEALAGYQRQSAFTRKTQEISELKKTLNDSLVSVQTEQQKYTQALKVLEDAFTGALNEPNWDELRKDPAAYDRERVAFLERKDQLSQLQAARQQAEQQAKETAKQARDSRMEEQRELLMTAIPEWIDSDRAAKEFTEMAKHAMKEYGFAAEDFKELDDHRVYMVLRKAWLYDNAKGKPGKAKGGKPNSPSLKPGSRPARGKGAKGAKAQQKALSRLKKTGSMDDALEAVIHMIDD